MVLSLLELAPFQVYADIVWNKYIYFEFGIVIHYPKSNHWD